jgi:mono/diheme cytochrome c family protein
MPRWFGTDEEARLVAEHIWSNVDQRHVSEIYGAGGVELGAIVYDKRCGGCHVIGGYADVSESLEGLTADEYNDLLDAASDYGEEMPDFTGDDREREALVLYLKTLGKGGEE